MFIKTRATHVFFTIAFILLAVCCSPAAQAAGPSMVALPSMNDSLTFGTATTLTNGQVLITGGIDSSYKYLATAQLYIPASQTFAPLGNMTTARASHTATLLSNGQVLIVGGTICNQGKCTVLSSAEIYDPGTRRFLPTGSMSAPRTAHTATLLADGTVLVAGGVNSDALSSAEIYNPATGAFTPTGSMAAERFVHTATLLNSGQVLITGGRGCSGDCDDNPGANTAELYVPSTGKFMAGGTMVQARILHRAVLLNNGQVLITGGRSCLGDCEANSTLQDAEIYDPTANSFTPAGTMISPRAAHIMIALSNGAVFVYGGSNCRKGFGCAYLTTGELYEPASGTFASAGSGSIGGENCVAALLSNDDVLVAGGRIQGSIKNGAELFSPGD